MFSRKGQSVGVQPCSPKSIWVAPEEIRLILAHLSRDCNREDLAIGTVRERLSRNGLDRITVLASRADAPISVVCPCSRSGSG